MLGVQAHEEHSNATAVRSACRTWSSECDGGSVFFRREIAGRDGRRGWIRTSDLHQVMVTLYELSYPPAGTIQRNAGQSICTLLVPVVPQKKPAVDSTCEIR